MFPEELNADMIFFHVTYRSSSFYRADYGRLRYVRYNKGCVQNVHLVFIYQNVHFLLRFRVHGSAFRLHVTTDRYP